MNDDFHLMLLPGLGADSRLFVPQRRAFPQLEVPPWIPPRRKESLPDYAARMSETVSPPRDKPFILGGVSFGGMLAYEMARHLKPDALVLIASCRTRRGMRPIFRIGACLLPFIPPTLLWSVPKLLAGPAMSTRRRMPAAQREMLLGMLKDADSRFMHWTVGAIMSWDPKPLEGIPVRQIHGSRDLMIPARRVEADEYIPGGGHLINYAHADRVNQFITQGKETSDTIKAFREDAIAYCELIDSLKDGKPEKFYTKLATCLCRLAKSADELPLVFADTNINTDDYRMTYDEWKDTASLIGNVVSPEEFSLMEADGDDQEIFGRVGMLWDCLADIYRDLKDGLRLYELGQEGIEEAIWAWKQFYNIHWGLHLFDALHAVHRIRYQLYEE